MPDSAFIATIPRLTTERLLLRELRIADFDAYAANMADPEATRFLSGTVDRRTAWRLFATATGGWALYDAGWWAVELRATGEFVGTVGAFFRETQLGRDLQPDLELGWTVIRAHWQKGYAREAAARALAFGFERYPVSRAIAYIDEGNQASIAVSKAIGMHFDGPADFYGEPTNRYVIERGRPSA